MCCGGGGIAMMGCGVGVWRELVGGWIVFCRPFSFGRPGLGRAGPSVRSGKPLVTDLPIAFTDVHVLFVSSV